MTFCNATHPPTPGPISDKCEMALAHKCAAARQEGQQQCDMCVKTVGATEQCTIREGKQPHMKHVASVSYSLAACLLQCLSLSLSCCLSLSRARALALILSVCACVCRGRALLLQRHEACRRSL